MDALYFMERVMGIEPTSSAWKADALADVLHPQICELQTATTIVAQSSPFVKYYWRFLLSIR